MISVIRAVLCLISLMIGLPATAQETVRLHAAGSLRGALTEISAAFYAATGVRVVAEYGASGLLRERIEAGETTEVFASADLGHPQRLAAAGRASPVVAFARNQLCAIAAPGVKVTTQTLLDHMLNPALKLAASTPKADPSGDYAWALFERAERLRPGAYRILDAKALKLVGGADAPAPPPDRSVYTMLIAAGKADLFLTYCTNAIVVARELPGATRIDLPESLTVGASYGLTVLNNAGTQAGRFALFVLSEQGQQILARHGFTPAVRY